MNSKFFNGSKKNAKGCIHYYARQGEMSTFSIKSIFLFLFEKEQFRAKRLSVLKAAVLKNLPKKTFPRDFEIRKKILLQE